MSGVTVINQSKEFLDLTKKEIGADINNQVTDYLESGEDPVPYFLMIKKMAEATTVALKNVDLKDAVITELEKSGRELTLNGSVMSVKNGYDILDYSKDPEWKDLQDQINSLKEQQKVREEFLRAVHKSNRSVFDGSDGAEVGVPVKSVVADTVQVKF